MRTQSPAGDALASLGCSRFGRRIAACRDLRRRSSRRTLQEGSGLEMARFALVAARPWLVALFFLNYGHFWWLQMEMQKSCPDFCLYWLGK